MAQNGRVRVTAGGITTWTELTNAAISTAITFQNISQVPITVKATTGSTAPSDGTGGVTYAPGQGEQGKTLAELFPGLSSPVRLWANSPLGGSMTVSHA